MSWPDQIEANNLDRTYIKTLLDVSGNIIIRKGNLTVLDGDVSFNTGNLYVGGDVNIIGNITATYPNNSIPASAINGQVAATPNFTGAVFMNDDLTVSKKLFVNEVNINGKATALTINDTADDTTNIATTAFVQAVVATVDLDLDGLSDVKYGGNNFTNSLLIGSTTTGILNNATFNVGVGSGVFNALTSGKYNTANGTNTLNANTTGEQNTANGYEALTANTTGNSNAANGCKSLQTNTTGYNNTANGYRALHKNTTANNNTANGAIALTQNTTGSYNTANGYSSGMTNTIGDNNTYLGANADAITGQPALSNSTAIGYKAKVTESNQIMLGTVTESVVIPGPKLTVAGNINFTGSLLQNGTAFVSGATDLNGLTDVISGGTNFANSLLIGSTTTGTLNYATANVGVGPGVFNALTSGQYNTAIGYQALKTNTTGRYNVANGYQSLYMNTEGWHNTANGYNALNQNTTGTANTANGSFALRFNTTGNNNTANGKEALYYNTTGQNNSAYGYRALYKNTTGSNNTATSEGALGSNTTGNFNVANGNTALQNNTTGSQNVANGYGSGKINTTGDNNTYLGANADAIVGQTALSNSTAIGYNAKVTESNQIMLGTVTETVVIPGNLNIATDKIATAPTVNGTVDNTNNIATTAFVQAVVATVDAGSMAANIGNKANIDSPTFTGVPAAPTAVSATNTTQIATTEFVQTRISELIDGAPGALNTLNELANALGSDANMSTTIFTAISTETSRATAAESTLQTNINNVSSSLSLDGLSDVISGGTNFENSLLIGSTTTGTLNAATYNVGVGSGVFNALTSGEYNTATGYQALNKNTTGINNVANGSYSLYSNTTGKENVANGHAALNANTTGEQNVATGYGSGITNRTGANNTYLGANADAITGQPALSNSTAIGYNAKVTESNQIMLGTVSETVVIPGPKLTVAGNINFTGSLLKNGTEFQGGAFSIEAGGFAHYSNNIHIGGSTAPANGSKLEVSGDIQMSGVIRQW